MAKTLHEAARFGHVDAVSQLLDSGENIDQRDDHSRTPLHLAAWAGHADVAHLLLERGASVSATASDDMAAIHFAAQKGHVDVIKTLLAGGARVSSSTRKGFRPLHYAAQNGHLHLVRLLGRRAPDSLTATTSKGKTPMDLAKNQEVRELLLSLEKESKEKKKNQGQKSKKKEAGMHGEGDESAVGKLSECNEEKGTETVEEEAQGDGVQKSGTDKDPEVSNPLKMDDFAEKEQGEGKTQKRRSAVDDDEEDDDEDDASLHEKVGPPPKAQPEKKRVKVSLAHLDTNEDGVEDQF